MIKPIPEYFNYIHQEIVNKAEYMCSFYHKNGGVYVSDIEATYCKRYKNLIKKCLSKGE